MSKSFRITADLLAADGACVEQVALVRQMFGDGPIACTAANLKRAAKAGADISWLQRYIPAPAWKAYDEATATAWKKYNEAIAPAWKKYNEATATAWKAYLEATAPAWKAYDEATATARKAYDEATAPAWKKYNEAIAPALAKALREAK